MRVCDSENKKVFVVGINITGVCSTRVNSREKV